jgi:hypothetical protein
MYSLLTTKTTDKIKCVTNEDTNTNEPIHIPSHEDIVNKMVALNIEVTDLKAEMRILKEDVADLWLNGDSAMTNARGLLEMSVVIVGIVLTSFGFAHGLLVFAKWSDRRLAR